MAKFQIILSENVRKEMCISKCDVADLRSGAIFERKLSLGFSWFFSFFTFLHFLKKNPQETQKMLSLILYLKKVSMIGDI